MQTFKEIDRLLGNCESDLMDYLMEGSNNKQYLKALKDNLSAARKLNAERGIYVDSPSTSTPLAQIKISPRTETFNGDKSEVLKMAYVLSRYNYNFFSDMFELKLNQTEIFEMVAAIMGVKSSTLRNYRDAFDFHVKQENTEKQRQGWKKPLTTDLQIVKETFEQYSEKDMFQEVRNTFLSIYPDIDLLIKIAYGFLFANKGVRTQLSIEYKGAELDAIVAPHTDKIAYMVFLGFGNKLTRGIYPGIYVYRRYGKVFTVYGESVTTSASNKWNIDLEQYVKIREHFSADEVNDLSKLTYDYLENHASKEFSLNSSEEANGGYRLQFTQSVVDDLKQIMDIYIAQYA